MLNEDDIFCGQVEDGIIFSDRREKKIVVRQFILCYRITISLDTK